MLVLASTRAHATITAVDFRGASRVVAVFGGAQTGATPTPGAPTVNTLQTLDVYAGLAGTCSASGDGATCNSCTATGTTAAVCNPNNIDLLRRPVFNFTSSTPGCHYIGYVNSGTVTVLGQSSAVGANVIMTDTWSTFCSRTDLGNASAGTGCTDYAVYKLQMIINPPTGGGCPTTAAVTGTGVEAKEFTLHVIPRVCPVAAKDSGGVAEAGSCVSSDPATDGIQSWKVLAGDSKVYMTNISTLGGRLLTNRGRFQGVRLYFQEVPSSSCATLAACKTAILTQGQSIANSSQNFFEAPLNNSGSDTAELGSNSFQGKLQNDRIYVFRLAMVDEAGNISHWTPKEYVNPTETENTSSNGVAGGISVGKGVHASSPGQVLGLLGQNQCFVATAAFGSSLDPRVGELRQWRDRYLLSNGWGKAFVRFYYKHGPIAAKWISDKPAPLLLVRWLLYPVVGLAFLMNRLGLPISFVLILGMVFLSAAVGPSVKFRLKSFIARLRLSNRRH